MKLTRNTILISGGSTGIGLELARRFHSLGNTVIVTGRNRERLDQIAREGIITYALDVTDKVATAAFAPELIAAHPALNVLVNNAGIMREENLKGSPTGLIDAEVIVDTNLLGPLRLTAAFIKHLTSQPFGAIVNVSSGLAFVPLVAVPTYCATKAAIHSWTQSLRTQLSDTQVEVLEIIPPGVQTELMQGQSVDEQMMPLSEFITETLELLERGPISGEIVTERVKLFRNAELEGRFESVFDMLNGKK
jgi:uncharacterized oxidoreductase